MSVTVTHEPKGVPCVQDAIPVSKRHLVNKLTTVEEKAEFYYNDYDFCFHASNAYYIRKEE